MKMTLSIPDPIGHRFQATIPAHQRSRFIIRLLERELAKRENALTVACLAANQDEALQLEIDEWQSFDDGIIEE